MKKKIDGQLGYNFNNYRFYINFKNCSNNKDENIHK